MIKNFIYLLGLCSFVQAANINIVEVQEGSETPGYFVSVNLSGTEKALDEFKEQLDEISTHLFIGLDGKVTCFVPSDSQLESVEKFPSESERVRMIRDYIKSIDINDYAMLSAFLLDAPYTTNLSQQEYHTSGLNIMLQRRGLESCDIICDVRRDHSSQEISQEMSALQDDPEALMAYKIDFLKNGYMTGYNVKLYTDEQINIIYYITECWATLKGALTSEIRITSRSHPNDFYALSCFFWPQLLSKYPNPDFYEPEPIDEIRD